MKNKTIVGLLLAVCVWGVTANAVQRVTTCDRECLRGKVTQLLYAFLKHDVSGLPVAGTLRVTEDAVEKPLANVGLIKTVTRLRGFRQDIIDESAGVAGADAMASMFDGGEEIDEVELNQAFIPQFAYEKLYALVLFSVLALLPLGPIVRRWALARVLVKD